MVRLRQAKEEQKLGAGMNSTQFSGIVSTKELDPPHPILQQKNIMYRTPHFHKQVYGRKVSNAQ